MTLTSPIRCQNLWKVYGADAAALRDLPPEGVRDRIAANDGWLAALSDVTLEVARGEVFVIMGLSGSGKSTLVRCMTGLIAPSLGDLLIDGVNLRDINPEKLIDMRRHKISMVFQDFALLPHRNVLDNVAYGLKVRGESVAQCQQRALHWISVVGLQGYEQVFIHQLSGGMRQRVGLARALATDTDIILMDEAFSALDPLIRAEMQDQLLELQRTLQKTIVFITHDLDEALRIGNRIAVLKDGQLIQVGSPQEILQAPADDYVGRFVQRQRTSA